MYISANHLYTGTHIWAVQREQDDKISFCMELTIFNEHHSYENGHKKNHQTDIIRKTVTTMNENVESFSFLCIILYFNA